MASIRKNDSLSIVSSNIRYDEPTDGPNSWAYRKAFLGRCLRRLGADLLGTQEGKRAQIDELAKQLPGLTLIEVHRDWDPNLMYPCLFFNRQRLSLRESGDIWLSRLPDQVGSRSFGSEFPRLCTWATFEPDLFVVNVHLDHLSPKIRKRQTQVLLEQISGLYGNSDKIILLGDFNEAPGGGVQTTLLAGLPRIHDPWIGLEIPEESSHHCFGEPIDYGSRVDWILADRLLVVKEMFLDKSQSSSGAYPSDHYPLMARFCMPTSGR